MLFSLVLLLGLRPPAIKGEIQAQYDRWSKAYMAADVPTLLSIITSDYQLTTVDKVVVKFPEYKAKLELRAKMGFDATVYSTSIQSLKLVGQEADVKAIETIETHRSDAKSFRSEKILHRHHYLDHWIRVSGAWRLCSTVTEKESTTVLR
jgi:hypothetical protein